MVKKSLLTLSLIVSSLSLASENNNNDKKGFKEGYNHAEGPIYTGKEGQGNNFYNPNNQWGTPQPQQTTERTYEVRGNKVVPVVRVSYQQDCVIN